jgi:hypothetical protein
MTGTYVKRATWLRRALWITPVVVLLLAGGGLLGLRFYLSASRSAELVAEHLQEMLGGRVEVEDAHIGLVGDSTVRGLRAYADGESDKPWLRIDDVRADLSVLGLLRGQSPEAIHLQGARVTLRFASDGHLLTQLPKGKKGAPAKLPHLHLEGSELTLDQQHRMPMILRGVNAEIAPRDNGMTLTGTITDPFWGNWKTHGTFDTAGGNGGITLDTDALAVTPTKLRAIAFVPLSVWEQVTVEGTMAGQVRLDLSAAGDKPSLRYRLEVRPREARVRVPSIEMTAAQVSGKAIIADEVVTLEDVRGKTAGGTIALTSAKLNFHEQPTRMAFKVGVQDVVLRDLPRSWKIPHFSGKLTGSADLVVTIKQGKVQTAGSGEGVIREERWSGGTLAIRLSMSSDGRRFHFHRPKRTTLTERIRKETTARTDALHNAPPPQSPKPQGEQAVPQQLDPTFAEPEPRVAEPQKRERADAGDFLHNAPAELVNLLGEGIQLTADGLAKGIDAAAKGLGKIKPPSKPGEEPTYLDVDLNLQNVDLAQLVQRLKLNLPYTIAGRLTFQVHASIPINTPGDLKAYRLRGNAKLPKLAMAGLEMTNAEARVRYADGVLQLENFHGQLPQPHPASPASRERERPEQPGQFNGKASVEVVPSGDVRAELKLDRVPLGLLATLLPQAKGTANGVLSGDVQARAPLQKLSDPATWRGSANLTAPAVVLYGVVLRNVSARVKVDESRAKLSTFKANVEGTPLTGEAELTLSGAYPFQAEVRTGRTDLAALNRLSPSFRPPIEIKGRAQLNGSVTGTLKPLQFDTKGQMRAENVVAESFTMDLLSFRWSKDKDALKLDDIQADLYGGSVSGSATVPLDARAAGTAKLRIRTVDAQALGKALPSFPVRIEGKVSGNVKGELAPPRGRQARAWTTDVELTAPMLKVQGIPAEKLQGTLDSRDGKTSYHLQGETLGGTFTLRGTLPQTRDKEKKSNEPVGRDGPNLGGVPPTENSGRSAAGRAFPRGAWEREGSELLPAAFQAAAEEPPGYGRLELKDAQLSRVWTAFGITGYLASLNGRFSIYLRYRHEEPDLFPVGDGTFRIFNVRWDDETLADSLRGNVRLTREAFQLYNLSGDLAGGQFGGRFAFGLKAASRGYFHIDLQQAEASRLLVPLPAVATRVKGPVDVNVRGGIGRDWDGSGGITLVRGQIYGMAITEWRIPVTFSFSPAQGSGELTVRDSHARIAQGRASFDSTLNWGTGLRLAGTLLFYQVDLRTLLRNSPSVSAYASGRVSGRVDLAGSEMHSLNDLTARVQAKMEQGQALQLPVLRQITPYLRPGASSATFQSGKLKGRLANGIFRIERATLVGDFIKMLILGTINLAGNLNLDVTAQTGLYCINPKRFSEVSARIPLIGAIPRLVLYEANALLGLAVVHLRVTGTVSSPVVRLEPLLVMTEEAIRFFFNRAVGLDIPNLP